MTLIEIAEILEKWKAQNGFQYICPECQGDIFIKLNQGDCYCVCGHEILIIDAIMSGVQFVKEELRKQREKHMKISEFQKLVNDWAKNGLKTVCDKCGNDLTVKPSDRVVVCGKCDSEYLAGHLINKEMPDWIGPKKGG